MAEGGGLPPVADDDGDGGENYHQFLVIGGGISGLSAASHLAKNGFTDFRLLEARNRLGGRVATMQIGRKLSVAHLSLFLFSRSFYLALVLLYVHCYISPFSVLVTLFLPNFLIGIWRNLYKKTIG